MRRPLCLLLPLVLGVTTSARAFTFLSGNLPQTLTAAQSPYVALSVLYLNSATCTVEPGVTVLFTSDTGIELQGATTVFALGTSSEPVVLDGYSGATWRGIYWSSADLSARQVVLEHCTISRATRAIYAAAGAGFNVTVRNCDIDASDGEAGIWLRDSRPFTDSEMRVEDTSVVGGALGGIYLYSDNDGDVLSAIRCVASDSPSTGLTIAGNTATASDVRAYRNEVGIRFVGVLSGATVSENETGIAVGGSISAPPIAENCVISGNDYGITVVGAARFTNCTIQDNHVYDVTCAAPILQFTTIDMRGCYWGPTTTQEMLAEGTFSDISTIFDWWDNAQYSLVDYSGFLAPVAAAPQTWGKMKAAFR